MTTAGRARPSAPSDVAPDVPWEWQRWTVSLLLDGLDPDDVVAIMVEEGLPGHQVTALCDEVRSGPVYAAGLDAVQRLQKLESVLSMRQQLRDLSPVGAQIERMAHLTSDDFLHDYYSANLPVILEDVCDEWAACSLWSAEYLLDKLRTREVAVTTDDERRRGQVGDGGFEREMMPFSTFVAKMSEGYVVVDDDLLFQTDAGARLWDDLAVDGRYLDPSAARSAVTLHLEPLGAVARLHHEVANLLLAQVAGEKHLTLISPLETHCVYNSRGLVSDVDTADPDYGRFPRFAAVRRFEATISPGEAIFIPVGWWHHADALDLSAGISFRNFLWPNEFRWSHPSRR